MNGFKEFMPFRFTIVNGNRNVSPTDPLVVHDFLSTLRDVVGRVLPGKKKKRIKGAKVEINIPC